MTKKKQRKIIRNTIIAVCASAAIIICSVVFVSWNRERLLKEQSSLITFTYPYPTNTYQWDHLQADGIYMSYEDDTYTSQQGIDVSVHQDEIDWQQVADAGIDFAFIRAAYRGYVTGELHADDNFDANMQGAINNGIDVGIYVFSQAVTVEEAAEEADFAIQSAKQYKVTMPIVFDMEGTIDDNDGRVMDISAEKRTQMAVTFMNRVKAAGYDTMYYGSTLLLESLFELQYVQQYPLWLAEYDAAYPNYPYQFDYWQYTSTAEVPGIEGSSTDMDIRFVKKS